MVNQIKNVEYELKQCNYSEISNFFFTVESRHGETYRGSDTTQKNVQHPVFIKGLQMTAFCFYALFSVSCFFLNWGCMYD